MEGFAAVRDFLEKKKILDIVHIQLYTYQVHTCFTSSVEQQNEIASESKVEPKRPVFSVCFRPFQMSQKQLHKRAHKPELTLNVKSDGPPDGRVPDLVDALTLVHPGVLVPQVPYHQLLTKRLDLPAA